MSSITDKIARLTAEDNGELNGIVNGGLLAEILNDLAPSYKILSVLITQTSDNDPALTILDNTFPPELDIEITRTAEGEYSLEMLNAFTESRTAIIQSAAVDTTESIDDNIKSYWFSESTIKIKTYRSSEGVSTLRDGVLRNSFFEIRVYPE